MVGTGLEMGLLGLTTPFPPLQELVLEPAQRRVRLEGLRYATALKQQAAQYSVALLHWEATWRQLSSPCGAWALRWTGAGLGGEDAACSTSGVGSGREGLLPTSDHHRGPSVGSPQPPTGSCPVLRHTHACV